MSQLASFFKGSDTRLGVFYPENYIIATFPSLDGANQAAAKLRGAGFSTEEVIAVAGTDFVKLMQEEMTLGGILMTEVSRFLDTEANYSDRDTRDAEHGAGILAVYCADEHTKQLSWGFIAPAKPIRARYYALSGVEHLAGES
jgi:hypothetical protein